MSVEPQTSGTSRYISNINLTLTCSVSVHSGGKPRRHPLPLQPHLLPHRHQVTGLHYTAPCRRSSQSNLMTPPQTEGGPGLQHLPPALQQSAHLWVWPGKRASTPYTYPSPASFHVFTPTLLRCWSAGSPPPAADGPSFPQHLQRHQALQGGRPATAAPPAGRPVSQRRRLPPLEPRADGETDAARGESASHWGRSRKPATNQ